MKDGGWIKEGTRKTQRGTKRKDERKDKRQTKNKTKQKTDETDERNETGRSLLGNSEVLSGSITIKFVLSKASDSLATKDVNLQWKDLISCFKMSRALAAKYRHTISKTLFIYSSAPIWRRSRKEKDYASQASPSDLGSFACIIQAGAVFLEKGSVVLWK